MPFSASLRERIAVASKRWSGLEEKKMFGGICYLHGGNMCFGIYRDYLIVRLGVEAAAAALEGPAVKPFDITGRPMKGWVMVAEEGLGSDADLKAWLERGRKFASSLPPKAGGKRRGAEA